MSVDGGTGALAAATAALLDWLRHAGAPARVVPPDDTVTPDGAAPRDLCVWPLAFLPERRTAGGALPEPLRLRLRFLVTTGGTDLPDVLDRVLLRAAVDGGFPLVIEPISADIWLALHARPRAGLLVDMPVRVERPAPEPVRVTSPLRVEHVPLRPFKGQVVGPGGTPLPGIRVEAVGSNAHTFTDPAGAFTFAGLPSGQQVQLLLSGKGLRLTTEVRVAGAEPVVIHCQTEEV
jgi:hypothetical protein